MLAAMAQCALQRVNSLCLPDARVRVENQAAVDAVRGCSQGRPEENAAQHEVGRAWSARLASARGSLVS